MTDQSTKGIHALHMMSLKRLKVGGGATRQSYFGAHAASDTAPVGCSSGLQGVRVDDGESLVCLLQ